MCVKKSPKDLRGDIATWEKEDSWETSGEVSMVTLRFYFSSLKIFSIIIMYYIQEGGHLLSHRSRRRGKDDFPFANFLVDWDGAV